MISLVARGGDDFKGQKLTTLLHAVHQSQRASLTRLSLTKIDKSWFRTSAVRFLGTVIVPGVIYQVSRRLTFGVYEAQPTLGITPETNALSEDEL